MRQRSGMGFGILRFYSSVIWEAPARKPVYLAGLKLLDLSIIVTIVLILVINNRKNHS